MENEEKVEFEEVDETADESVEETTEETTETAEETAEENEIDIIDVVRELSDRVAELTDRFETLVADIAKEKETKKEKLKGFFAPVDKEKIVDDSPTYDNIFIKG